VITLGAGALSLSELRRIYDGEAVALDPAANARMAASRAVVERAAAGDAAIYGVNTGFGRLARTRIAAADLARLQRNLLLSHAAGVGPPLPDAVVRLTIALKAHSLAAGASGVRPVVVERLLRLLDTGALPVVPGQGSVGASGDLAPLAHLSLALIGEGFVTLNGAVAPAAEACEPLTLAAKEGLALINGTQVSTALALAGLFAITRCFDAALVAGAMSVEAARGSHHPFDARIQLLRGQPGQIEVAARLRALLDGSLIHASHQGPDCDRVQDPYSLRCQPQVMGAVLDSLSHAERVLVTEANGVTDNPLVLMDGDDGTIVSGGNFHAEPVAIAADLLAIAAAEIGAMSERRIALLTDASLSGLPPFLTRDPGLNSGFMIAHVTAAALASENKSLAHPASVDSLPTSANQEDHVSMATFAARRLGPLAENVAGIVAIELLAAAQGLDLLRPLRSSPPVEAAHAKVRSAVPSLGDDRQFAPDIAAITQLVAAGVLDR